MIRFQLLIVFFVLIGAAEATAQCAGGVAEGDVDPNNRCQLCNGGLFESLPERTACDAERRVQCDAGGAFRVECVLLAGASETTCESNYRWEACPNGFACGDGFCLQSCATTAQCRTGFECVGETCRRVEPPEMGADAGPSGDVGEGPRDMETADVRPIDMDGMDTSTSPDEGGSQSDFAMRIGTKPRDRGCQTTTIVQGSSRWLSLVALGILGLRRRRA